MEKHLLDEKGDTLQISPALFIVSVVLPGGWFWSGPRKQQWQVNHELAGAPALIRQ